MLPQYHHKYAKIMTYDNTPCPSTVEGQAIFSKGRLDNFSFQLLPMSPDSGDSNQRGILRATTTIDSVKVCVFATHLSLSSNEQLINAKHILHYVSKSATSPHTVVMGDFNSYHHNALLPLLTNSALHGEISGTFSDVWATVKGTNDRDHFDRTACTYACNHVYPYQQRDHILFFREGWHPPTLVELVGNMDASDHLAVVTDLSSQIPLTKLI